MVEDRGFAARFRLEHVLLLLAVLVSLVLRVAVPDLTEFKHDEADFIVRAGEMIDAGRITLDANLSSTKFMNSPLTVWLVAPWVWLGLSPAAIVVVFGIVQTACLAILTWTLSRAVSWQAALAFILVYGAGFWAVFLTRKVTDASLGPAAVCLFLASLIAWWVAPGSPRRRWSWFLAAVACLGFAVQFNIAAFVLAPPLAILLLVALVRREAPLWLPVPAIAVFAAVWSPVWLRDLIRNDGNLGLLFGVAGGERRLDLAAFEQLASLLFDGGAPFWFGAAADGAARNVSTGILPWTGYGLTALILGLALRDWMVIRSIPELRDIRDDRASAARRLAVVGLLFVSIPLVLYSFRSFDLALHYLSLVIPVGAVLLAAAVAVAFRTRWFFLGVFLLWLTVMTAFLQTALIAQSFDVIASQNLTGGFGIPLRYHQQAADRVAGLAQGRLVQFAPTETDQPRAAQALARGRFPLIVTQPPFTTLARPDVAVQWSNLGYVECDLARGDVAVVVPPGRWCVFGVVSRDQSPPRLSPDRSATFAGGPVIHSAATTSLPYPVNGSRFALVIDWSVPEATTRLPDDTRFFVHLLDGEGRMMAQADGMPWPPHQWQPGDRLGTVFTVPVPPDAVGQLRFRFGVSVPGQGRLPVQSSVYEVQDGNALIIR